MIKLTQRNKEDMWVGRQLLATSVVTWDSKIAASIIEYSGKVLYALETPTDIARLMAEPA